MREHVRWQKFSKVTLFNIHDSQQSICISMHWRKRTELLTFEEREREREKGLNCSLVKIVTFEYCDVWTL